MIQKHEVINLIMRQYSNRTPITKDGVELLYDRAISRGYDPCCIYTGLKTVICKNYLREEYRFPNGDPEMESLDESRYIEDFELRDIMNGNLVYL